jgi:hypothetical protein
MFAPHGPTSERRVLLGHDRNVSLRSDDSRHRVDLRCRCGTRVQWLGGAAVQR